MKVWCPDEGDEDDARVVDKPHLGCEHAAEMYAMRQHSDDAFDSMNVNVRDDAGEVHGFRVRVSYDPTFYVERA